MIYFLEIIIKISGLKICGFIKEPCSSSSGAWVGSRGMQEKSGQNLHTLDIQSRTGEARPSVIERQMAWACTHSLVTPKIRIPAGQDATISSTMSRINGDGILSLVSSYDAASVHRITLSAVIVRYVMMCYVALVV